jgi:hypothetical protein
VGFSQSLHLRFASATAVAVLVTAGCTSDHEVSATVAAESNEQGQTKVRSPTAAERANLDETMRKMAQVDARFPRPPIPKNVPSDLPIGVTAPGIVELQNGRHIRIDGVSCSNQGIEILRRMMIDKTTRVIIIPSTSDPSKDPMPADVWTVDSFLQDKMPGAGLDYSNVVETAITSGWCTVEPTATSKHNERYAALETAFAREAKP